MPTILLIFIFLMSPCFCLVYTEGTELAVQADGASVNLYTFNL